VGKKGGEGSTKGFLAGSPFSNDVVFSSKEESQGGGLLLWREERDASSLQRGRL